MIQNTSFTTSHQTVAILTMHFHLAAMGRRRTRGDSLETGCCRGNMHLTSLVNRFAFS